MRKRINFFVSCIVIQFQVINHTSSVFHESLCNSQNTFPYMKKRVHKSIIHSPTYMNLHESLFNSQITCPYMKKFIKQSYIIRFTQEFGTHFLTWNSSIINNTLLYIHIRVHVTAGKYFYMNEFTN